MGFWGFGVLGFWKEKIGHYVMQGDYLALIMLFLPLIHVLQVLGDLCMAKLLPRLGLSLCFMDLTCLVSHVLPIYWDCII